MNRFVKNALTRFRFGYTSVNINYRSYSTHNQPNVLCPLCKRFEENEIHFVLCCPALDDLRKRYIHSKHICSPYDYNLVLLMWFKQIFFKEVTINQIQIMKYSKY